MTATNSEFVFVECSNSVYCNIQVKNAKWVEVICNGPLTYCYIFADNVDYLNVDCKNSDTCIVDTTDNTNFNQFNHVIDCKGSAYCILYAQYVTNLEFSCQSSTTFCYVDLVSTKTNSIIFTGAASSYIFC